MVRRAFVPFDNLDERNGARIFGESFQLEDTLAKQLEGSWHLEGYVDGNQIEHVRMYRMVDETDQSQQWEILRYDEDEAPLELLMLRGDM